MDNDSAALPIKCAGCFKRIRSRYFVEALDKPWHERCLTCDVCDEILFSFGKNFYYKHYKKLCRWDYMRLYVRGGTCSMCACAIPSTEKALKFNNNTNYHVKCFSCAVCRYKFSKGDVVYIPQPTMVLCHQHGIEYNFLCSLSSVTSLIHPNSC